MSKSIKYPNTSPLEEIRSGFSRMGSVLFALFFKEFKIKLGRSKLGIVWVVFEPLTAMLVLSAVWLVIGRHTIENIHVMLFIGSGFFIYYIIRRGLSPIPQGIKSNAALLNYPGVKPIDTIIARFVLEMWLLIMAGTLMFFWLYWVLGEKPTFPDPLLCFLSIGIAYMISFGVGLTLGTYGTFYESVGKTVSLLTHPLLILSAVLYSINDLPAKGRDVLSWNPIVHVVTSFRQGALGTSSFEGHGLWYPGMFGLALLGFSFVAYSANRFKLIQK